MSTWTISSDSSDDAYKPNAKKYKSIRLSDSDDENLFSFSQVAHGRTNVSNVLDDKGNGHKMKLNGKDKETTGKCNDLTKIDKNMETLKRKAAYSEIKDMRPEECLKSMICLVGNSVAAMSDSFIPQLKLESGVTFKLIDIDEAIVKWQRKVIFYETDKSHSSMVTMQDVHDEPEVMVVLQINDFLSLIQSENNNTTLRAASPALSEWSNLLKIKYAGYNIHVVCIGMKAFIRCYNNKKKKEYEDNVLAGFNVNAKIIKSRKHKQNYPDVSPNEIEDSLVKLQLFSCINVLLVEDMNELVILVQQMTKSIGEAPFKRMKRKNVQFINDKTSVKVDSTSGEGAHKAWQQMLEICHNVSSDMSRAILCEYPTLNKLIRTYEELTQAQCENLLSEIVVRRGVGSLANHRRLGYEISKRIYKMIMSVNGREHLM